MLAARAFFFIIFRASSSVLSAPKHRKKHPDLFMRATSSSSTMSGRVSAVHEILSLIPDEIMASHSETTPSLSTVNVSSVKRICPAPKSRMFL
ncbi:MAG: hypothetical protein BWY28_02570 [bacterium ADurb.Bin236]|nr:MAG: hypothetical protein BWY28_02570 [bacterium ADurb.Bin236]